MRELGSVLLQPLDLDTHPSLNLLVTIITKPV